ncbi:hypothetical protein OFR22_12720 [Brachyspira hyodysenteriae]|uniref:hypothetical protein n=1 Tax=Brachyspira hyodysenteriae TaxID=159 RepID=UPI0022CD741D|nr:hypothetical protein [Brachyspira hyodysenteriae]MCZ9838653.1 hypothetical protein [Brachyspira hyodysenteriae]MCZ9847956.1 hypothetical protein [Brachyspira hyodysenteriae]MCZ9851619.1 hypothetical protein [Brachyspira hyodysenteriae]MCZ9859642.1 hypothetical protein [Brachyspira hyodysenteriae]MCZ9870246.1 hypothetical protein [Brachyspira hyodysenteriae]
MKKILIAIISIFIMQFSTVFADFNAGIGIYIPLGASISQSYQEHKLGVNSSDGKLSTDASFEWGIGITPGIYNGFDNYMGFSIALDLAYHRDVYAFNESKQAGAAGQYQNVKTTYYFDTLSIGILPKFNIYNFFIGLGAGVKIPLAGGESTKNYNTTYNQFETSNSYYTLNDIKNKYQMSVIPYLKLTLDYLFFFSDETALGLGLYVGYDFGPGRVNDSRFNKNDYGAVDIGGQFSFYFVDN